MQEKSCRPDAPWRAGREIGLGDYRGCDFQVVVAPKPCDVDIAASVPGMGMNKSGKKMIK